MVLCLKSYVDFVVKRCYHPYDISDPVVNIYLYGFSDASQVAFGKVNVALIAGKSRVVPLNKKYTIPRLELLCNVVLSNLMKVVHRTLSEENEIDDYFCWSDAKDTLAWIKSTKQDFKFFVKNRLEKIRENVDPLKWNYCPTQENPADLVTRFTSGNFCENLLWQEGPTFLKCGDSPDVKMGVKNDERFELQNDDDKDISALLSTTQLKQEYFSETINGVDEINCNKDNSLAAIKENNYAVSTVNSMDSPVTKCKELKSKDISIKIDDHSKLSMLLKVSSWVLTFINNIHINKERRNLKEFILTDESRSVLRLWLRSNQAELLRNPNYGHMKLSLNLVKESDGIIRAYGRVQRANLLDSDVRKK